MAAKIQDGRHKIQLFDFSTSDGSDFPLIIEIALFSNLIYFEFLLLHKLRLNTPDMIISKLSASRTISLANWEGTEWCSY